MGATRFRLLLKIFLKKFAVETPTVAMLGFDVKRKSFKFYFSYLRIYQYLSLPEIINEPAVLNALTLDNLRQLGNLAAKHSAMEAFSFFGRVQKTSAPTSCLVAEDILCKRITFKDANNKLHSFALEAILANTRLLLTFPRTQILYFYYLASMA